MPLRLLAVLVSALCYGACAASNSDCATPTTCGECATRTACGWCQATRRCANAASSDACGATWVTSAAVCPPPDAGPCGDSTECNDCTYRAVCGWCGATGGCMQSADGTAPPGCSSGWAWISTSCPGAGMECPTHGDCDSCTGDFNCGWCPATGQCLASDGTSPTMGSCTGGFATSNLDCPAGIAMCAAHTSCDTCSADNCGWCGATGACTPANVDGTGPWMGTCAHDWAWTFTACPGGDGGVDAAPPDAGPSDSGSRDAGAVDSGPIDAGVVDAGVSD